MIKFKVNIADIDGVSGFYTGEVSKGNVTSTALEWERGSKYDSGPTQSYGLEIEGGEKFNLSGDAYRNLDQHGLIPRFELLAAMNSDMAHKVAEIVEEGETVFSALVTSDVTQSCTVYSSSDEDVQSILTDAQENGDWELNDGNSLDDVYFGGGSSEDIEEIDLEDLLDRLIKKATDRLKAAAKEEAFELASSIARLPKSGETVDGKPCNPADSHHTLIDLIARARQMIDLIP